MYKLLCGHMFAFLLGIYLGVELLGHVVMTHLKFTVQWGLANLYSCAVWPPSSFRTLPLLFYFYVLNISKICSVFVFEFLFDMEFIWYKEWEQHPSAFFFFVPIYFSNTIYGIVHDFSIDMAVPPKLHTTLSVWVCLCSFFSFLLICQPVNVPGL